MAHDDTAPEALRRAEADLAAGRAWNAANRLQSFLSHDPLHMAVRSRLGDLLLDMGAPADAGAVLLATERDDDAARGAIAAWMAYLDTHAVAALQGLRGQGLVDEDTMAALGPVGRSRTEPLVLRARVELRDEDEDQDDSDDGETSAAESALAAGCGLGCGALIAVFGAGLFQIAKWLGL